MLKPQQCWQDISNCGNKFPVVFVDTIATGSNSGSPVTFVNASDVLFCMARVVSFKEVNNM